MRMWARTALVVAVVAAVSAGVGLGRRGERPPPGDLAVPLTPGDAVRGQHLVDHVLACAACHGHDLGGAEVSVGVGGHVWAPNLTPAGGERAPDAWVAALRAGQGADGEPLRLMSSGRWASLSDADLADVLAALATLRPVVREPPPRPGRAFRWLADWVSEAAVSPPAAAAPMQPDAAYGAYVSVIAGCAECHGPQLEGRTTLLGRSPPVTPGASLPFAGAHFEAAVRRGRGADGRPLASRMPWEHYAGLTDLEVDALWAHVRLLQDPSGADGVVSDTP